MAIDKAAGAEREVTGTVRAGFGNRNGKTDLEGGIMLNSLPEDMKHIDVTAPSTPAAHLWQGWGTALKPAWEPIIVAMKPLEGTYAENAQKWGVAGLNIDGGRIGTEGARNNGRQAGTSGIYGCIGATTPVDYGKGRWPANLLLDEGAARLLDEQSGVAGSGSGRVMVSTGGQNRKESQSLYAGGGMNVPGKENTGIRDFGDSGGASRFFYTAKASSSERNAGLEDCEVGQTVGGGGMNNTPDDVCGKYGSIKAPQQNIHPTVKPVSLMRYLCKLTRTPTGGVVLDPFMGSGTTGIACILEHRDFIGIEIDAQYAEIARKRIADMTGPLFIPPEVKHGESYLYN